MQPRQRQGGGANSSGMMRPSMASASESVSAAGRSQSEDTGSPLDERAHLLSKGGGRVENEVAYNRDAVLESVAKLADYGRSLEKPQTGDIAEPATKQAWLRVTLYAALACLGSILFGYEISIISGAKEEFRNEFELEKESFLYGFMAASMTVGAMLGTASAGVVQDSLGRRAAVLVAASIYITGALLEATAAHLVMLAVGRVIVGVGIGWFSSTVPLYIAELAPSKIRGKLVTLNQFFVCVGILIGYIINYSVKNWRFELGAGIPIAAGLAIAFLCFTPESPRWLVSKNRLHEALGVLKQVRQSPEADCVAELAVIAGKQANHH